MPLDLGLVLLKYAHWTTHEIRRLKQMFAVNRNPGTESLAEAFSRHPIDSTLEMSRRLGLRSKRENCVPLNRAQHWLRIAHEHFSRREIGLLA